MGWGTHKRTLLGTSKLLSLSSLSSWGQRDEEESRLETRMLSPPEFRANDQHQLDLCLFDIAGKRPSIYRFKM